MSAATETLLENLISHSKFPTSFSFSYKGSEKIGNVAIQDLLQNKIHSEDASTERLHVSVEDRASCVYCKRFFSRVRIDKHQQVCETNYRKQEFFKKVSTRQSKSTKPSQVEFHYPNSKWQKQHFDLINKLRLNSCDNYEEYINCPFCLRRFAPGPAEKHINKCKYIIHKPRPPPNKLLPDLKHRYNSYIQEEFKLISSERNSPKPGSKQSDVDITERIEGEKSTQHVHVLKKVKLKKLTEPRSKSIYKAKKNICRCGESLPARALYCMMCGIYRYK